MAARVSQEGLLVVDVGTPKARVSQEGLLVVDVGTPKARASQVGLLAIDVGTPKARASQVGLLVIYPLPSGGPYPFFLDNEMAGGYAEMGM